jgi:hypothetical protein
MMTIQDIERVIQSRAKWGKEYRDLSLESKRRSAILYLRNCSKRGWVIDRAVRKAA